MKILNFKTNLKCNNCIKAIEPELNSLEGVKFWTVDINARPATLKVETETLAADVIIKTIEKAGYRIELV